MREFVVTLKSGKRYTVKADHVRRDPDYLAFLAGTVSVGSLDPFEGVVALFEARQVAVVVDRAHLVSEEKVDPIDPHYVAADPDSDIPF